jgi:RNA polymerase sigma-70 factor (ECF subfamily)
VSFSAAEVERWIPRLRRYAIALTGNRHAADDLIQDTLERAWRKRALWHVGTDLRAWLFTVMHNVHASGLRGRREHAALDDAADAEALVSSAHAAEGAATLAELQGALLRLSEEQRQVVLLVGLEQMSYAEAASVLEVPIGTVMSRLSRGRDALRTLLSREPAAAALRRVK